MRLTLITVSYNSENTIRDTFESVRTQRIQGFDFEYIHIDGSSTDSTMLISMEFDDIISTRVSENDSGIYNAMNKGIKMASGDIVGFLNSDDIFAYSEVLLDVVNLFNNKDVDCLYGDLDYVDKKDTKNIVRKWRSGAYGKLSFRFGWMPPHPTFYAKRDCFVKYGIFDETFSSSADYELMLRFLHVNKSTFEYLEKVMIKMRVGGHSNQSIIHRFKVFKEDIRAWRQNGFNLGALSVVLKIIRKTPQYLK